MAQLLDPSQTFSDPKLIRATVERVSERQRQDKLPKPVATSIEFVTSMCASQAPLEVVVTLNKYAEKLEVADKLFQETKVSFELAGQSANATDEYLRQREALQRAIEEAERASKDASILLQLAKEGAQRKEERIQRDRLTEQDRRDREDNELKRRVNDQARDEFLGSFFFDFSQFVFFAVMAAESSLLLMSRTALSIQSLDVTSMALETNLFLSDSVPAVTQFSSAKI
jgi:hypothetical protein